MTWQTEFPDFKAADMPEPPEGFEDVSWHNDAMPSFFNEELQLRLWINYADPQMRESTAMTRYCLEATDAECQPHEPHWYYNTDNWSGIMTTIKHHRDAKTICRKWVARIGGGFHPDTRGKDYDPAMSDAEIKEYDADMETLFSLAFDPYRYGVMAMADAGLIEGQSK